jgi:hypothetical protein
MGLVGKSIRAIHGYHDRADSSQPEVIDEVAPPPDTQNVS